MQILNAVQTATILANSMAYEKPGREGVTYERVDLSSRNIIHILFPEHTRGFAFFLGLLSMANDRCDAAVVSVRGCAELSRLMHLSYDTTQKYLVTHNPTNTALIAGGTITIRSTKTNFFYAHQKHTTTKVNTPTM